MISDASRLVRLGVVPNGAQRKNGHTPVLPSCLMRLRCALKMHRSPSSNGTPLTGLSLKRLEPREGKLSSTVLRACLSAPWKGAELQWESKPTRQLSLQPVAAEAGQEEMNGPKPLVQKARSAGQRASRP